MFGGARYYLMSTKYGKNLEEQKIKEAAFERWHKMWKEIFKVHRPNFDLTSDEFLKHDFLSVISIDGVPAATHLYSIYNINDPIYLNSEYLKMYPEEYFEALRGFGAKFTMSMEYLSVYPEFRKSNLGLSFADVIAQLGTYVFSFLNLDAVLARSRKDLKVNVIAKKLGFIDIIENFKGIGFDFDLQACLQGDQKQLADSTVNSFVNRLWDNRIISDVTNSHIQHILNVTNTPKKLEQVA